MSLPTARPSLEIGVEHGENVRVAKELQSQFESADLHLRKKGKELNAHRFIQGNGGLELENEENRDPAVVAAEFISQISYLRKLKFQYLEQNAKDKYVKSIVSDIDDAPIVTAEQNTDLASLNEEKKERLKNAKRKLAEVQNDIRLLAPMVEKDYLRVEAAADRAAFLSQKITEAQTSLMLLHQTHPQPRLTIALADEKLADQVTEMQRFSDDVQAMKQKDKAYKLKIKNAAGEMENLRSEAAEAEKLARMVQVDEDDSRLAPLYEWYTTSKALHIAISNMEESHSASENELQLTYRIHTPPPSKPNRVTITLIFAPDTRRFADADVAGLEELGMEFGDLVEEHVQLGDVHDFVASVLMRARAAG